MKYLHMCALENEPMGLVIFPFHRVINLERQRTNLQAKQNHVTPMADHEMQKTPEDPRTARRLHQHAKQC